MPFRDTLYTSNEQDGLQYPLRVDGKPVPSPDCAIMDVPDDVMVTFFNAALDHEGLPSVIISHVSRRWRQLSIATPTLWSKIDIAPDVEGYPRRYLSADAMAALSKEEVALHGEEERRWKQGLEVIHKRVAAYLHRSGNSPLHISLKTREWSNSGYDMDVVQLHKSLVQLLHPTSPRWESLKLQVSVQDLSSPLLPLLQIAPERIPNLRSLRMKVESHDDMTFAMFLFPIDYPGFDLGTPLASTIGALKGASLTSLEVVDTAVQVFRMLPAPWATLTRLSIISGRIPLPFTQLDAITTLRNCPKLVECRIDFGEKRDAFYPMTYRPPQPLPQQLVTLPDLRTLSLSGENPTVQGLPSRLVLPSLTNLTIDHSTLPYSRDSAGSPHVEWLKEHGYKLSNATIDYVSLKPEALLDCLQGLPNVVDLTLLCTSSIEEFVEGEEQFVVDNSGAAVLDDSLISLLTPRIGEEGAEAQSCLCPQLQRLKCKMGAGERNEEAMLKMVLARYGDGTKRMRGSVRRIEEVILSYNRPRSVDIIKELAESGVDTFHLAFEASYIG